MNTNTQLTAYLALCLSVAASVLAQGSAFTYQGRLNDRSNPANGCYDFTFALFSVGSGSGMVGVTQTHLATAVSNGPFTVTLDFGAGVFPGANRWLELAVRTNGAVGFTDLAPRQQITAIPYAITAGNVTGSVAAGQLTGALGQENIGAGTITSTMLAAGSVTSNQLAAGAVSLDKLSTTLAGPLLNTYNHPNPTTAAGFGGAVAAVGSDRVFVGASGDNTGANDAGAAYLFSVSDPFVPGLVSAGVVERSITAAGVDSSLGLWSKAETNLYYNDGRVGIGNASPEAVFHVQSAASPAGDATLNTAVFLAPSLGPNWSHSHYGATGDWYIRSASSAGKVVLQNSGGNVGIGTSAPSQKLHVIGNILASGTVTPNSDRNAKTGFAPVDTAAVLEKVAHLPIQQ
jgi:hypothetical protein